MPVILKKEVGNGWFALWRITESEQELLQLVTATDRESVATFISPSRRRERLAWRAMLQELLPGSEVAYDESGAPGLVGREGFISVSHSTSMVALAFSFDPCAIDTDALSRDYLRVYERYIDDCERQLVDCVSNKFCAIIWCAKEALYKYSGRKELDLKRDIRIISYDINSGAICGQISDETVVELTLEEFDGNVIVYKITRNV